MRYNIAAKPTRYNGVEFRSRLEARWAAFFDMCGWRWDYEPIDLQGWVPDFSISTPLGLVMAEVKPVEICSKIDPCFSKAVAHWQSCQVILLGLQPRSDRLGIGTLLDPPSEAKYDWIDLHNLLFCAGADQLWNEAGNLTRWHP